MRHHKNTREGILSTPINHLSRKVRALLLFLRVLDSDFPFCLPSVCFTSPTSAIVSAIASEFTPEHARQVGLQISGGNLSE
jgi:hypothetical protein